VIRPEVSDYPATENLSPNWLWVGARLHSLRENSFTRHNLTSAAKAAIQSKAVIAALKALRHPKSIA